MTSIGKPNAEYAADLAEEVFQVLRGKRIEIIGATLAQLSSRLIVSLHPELRKEAFDNHVATIRELVPIMEREIFNEDFKRPNSWPPIEKSWPQETRTQ